MRWDLWNEFNRETATSISFKRVGSNLVTNQGYPPVMTLLRDYGMFPLYPLLIRNYLISSI